MQSWLRATIGYSGKVAAAVFRLFEIYIILRTLYLRLTLITKVLVTSKAILTKLLILNKTSISIMMMPLVRWCSQGEAKEEVGPGKQAVLCQGKTAHQVKNMLLIIILYGGNNQ